MLDQLPVQRRVLLVNRLQAAGPIHVRDRRDVGLLGRQNVVHLNHERIRIGLIKVVASRLLQDRRRKRPELLAMLDAGIQDVLHIGAARIGDNAAIAKRPRSPFHPALKPAQHVAVSHNFGCALNQRVLSRSFV